MIVGRLGAAGGLLLQEKRGEEVLGKGRGGNMQGKILSEGHASVFPKPPTKA